MKKLFFGGIHPSYKKEMSTKSDKLLTLVPKQAVIPLCQHIGDVCEPLVQVGDTVLIGQKIGDGQNRCVPVHASVSGSVSAIEPRLCPNGQTVMSVIIENDFKDNTIEYSTCADDTDSILHAIREAGIVGMGGAAFPSNLKALSAMGNIDTVIANACECEPYITADDMLLRTNARDVLEGMLILRNIFSPIKTVLAIEDNKVQAIKTVKELMPYYPDIEIKILPTRYPQGSEKQLIQAVTGRQVPPNKLPVDVDCVVFNVSTFAAIYKAVKCGKPLTERIVTVSGEAIARPQNFVVRIGTPFEDLISAAGGLDDNTQKVINGGPMMGVAQAELSVPVVKATNSVLCLFNDKNDAYETKACIRCGKCVSACPMHLKPLYIARFANAGDAKELTRLNVTDCIECGCCSFSCPAKLPLVEKCRLGKKIVKEAAE